MQNRQQTALAELDAQLGSFPAHSAEARALLAFARERVRTLALTLAEPANDASGKHCARCRRDIATELGRQAWMN